MTLRDPRGNELKQVLLQILDKDEHGPVMLRARRDHEVIDLADEKNRSFLIVWVPADQILGEVDLANLISDFEKIKAAQRELADERVKQDLAIKSAQREFEAMDADLKLKTDELRRLQRERDPARVDALVKEAVERSTTALERMLVDARNVVAQRDSEIRELKESKRRLKEANERLKEKK